MKHFLFLFVYLIVINVYAQNSLEKQSIDFESKVVKCRCDFHQNPELSNREFKTAKKYCWYCNNTYSNYF